ncbi:hypothetical protein CLOP_g25524 [Closterium sp. NIES-67]|nr:hypothetical protein CLOP_g25524 [Closterium sp. NIES-67]
MDALQRLLPPFLIDEIETHLSSRRAFAAFAAVERCILEDRSHRRVFDKLVAPLADRNGPCAKEGAAAREAKDAGSRAFADQDFAEAAACYSKALRYAPLASPDLLAVLFTNRATCLHKMGQLMQAEEDCSHAIHLSPAYCKAWFRRGCVRAAQKKFHSAVSDFKKALLLEEAAGSRPGAKKIVDELRRVLEEQREEEDGKNGKTPRKEGAEEGSGAVGRNTVAELTAAKDFIRGDTATAVEAAAPLPAAAVEAAAPLPAAAAAAPLPAAAAAAAAAATAWLHPRLEAFLSEIVDGLQARHAANATQSARASTCDGSATTQAASPGWALRCSVSRSASDAACGNINAAPASADKAAVTAAAGAAGAAADAGAADAAVAGAAAAGAAAGGAAAAAAAEAHHATATQIEAPGSQGLPAGTVVLVEQPIAAALLKPHRSSCCHHCLLPLPSNPFPCPGCSFALFCQPSCAAVALGVRSAATATTTPTDATDATYATDAILARDDATATTGKNVTTAPGAVDLVDRGNDSATGGKHVGASKCATAALERGTDTGATEAEALLQPGWRAGVTRWGEHLGECGGSSWHAALPVEACLAGRVVGQVGLGEVGLAQGRGRRSGGVEEGSVVGVRGRGFESLCHHLGSLPPSSLIQGVRVEGEEERGKREEVGDDAEEEDEEEEDRGEEGKEEQLGKQEAREGRQGEVWPVDEFIRMALLAIVTSYCVNSSLAAVSRELADAGRDRGREEMHDAKEPLQQQQQQQQHEHWRRAFALRQHVTRFRVSSQQVLVVLGQLRFNAVAVSRVRGGESGGTVGQLEGIQQVGR